MGVVGFGDTVIARYTHPPLTSVSVESHLIGNSAIELLLNLINGREDIENRYIPSRIVLRSSSVRKAQ
jgi:LacI family transcriptional regulator